MVKWFSNLPYSYAGLTHKACPLPVFLMEQLVLLNNIFGTRLNSVLCNYYPDGNHMIPPHADNEKQLGNMPTILSISLGATRDFILQATTGKTIYRVPLVNGSLLVMGGMTQTYWGHSIEKDTICTLPRINLTFRTILDLN